MGVQDRGSECGDGLPAYRQAGETAVSPTPARTQWSERLQHQFLRLEPLALGLAPVVLARIDRQIHPKRRAHVEL
jgi:hypothetical protein